MTRLKNMVGMLSLLLAGDAFMLHAMNARRQRDGNETLGVRALVQGVGYMSLAISADCAGSRCLLEGVAACLGDIPGGYCFHTSCDTVCEPILDAEEAFEVEIVRSEQ